MLTGIASICRANLPVPIQERSISIYENGRTIERASFLLDNAERKKNMIFSGCAGKAVEIWRWDGDSGIIVFGKPLPTWGQSMLDGLHVSYLNGG